MERLKVTIGETAFYIARFDPFTALRMFGDLQKEILPAVGHLLQAAFGDEGGGKQGQPVDKEALDAAADAGLVEALRELSEKLNGAALEAWANRLLDPECVAVSINGRDAKLDKATRSMAFRDAGDILELMFHIIRFNFADFLLRWVGRSGPAQKLLARLSDGSETTSSKS
ncbi:phage tail assembly chaperone [Cupriavidus alkaliphilus]|uniref:phage tail assembly chaperone n=1 Tax=Cupriavidus alkaliphilus TaxID=942866 RepID=UPI001622177E|nr:hypothetical protein [Cupriavidus alkaliphilus]MBB2918334.1 hypothetical protein [Cupriavidus alkaliphilus]